MRLSFLAEAVTSSAAEFGRSIIHDNDMLDVTRHRGQHGLDLAFHAITGNNRRDIIFSKIKWGTHYCKEFLSPCRALPKGAGKGQGEEESFDRNNEMIVRLAALLHFHFLV